MNSIIPLDDILESLEETGFYNTSGDTLIQILDCVSFGLNSVIHLKTERITQLETQVKEAIDVINQTVTEFQSWLDSGEERFCDWPEPRIRRFHRVLDRIKRGI